MSGDEDAARGDQQKVVVNPGYGGFSLAEETVRWLRGLGCEKAEQLTLPGETYSDGSQRNSSSYVSACYPRGDDMPRDDPHLVKAVEEGVTTELRIVEVPAGTDWCITEYDGAETVREKHHTYPSGELETGLANSYEEDEDDE